MLGTCLLVCVASCASNASHSRAMTPPCDAPDVPAVAKAWNKRAASVDQLYGRGIFQANWVDGDGGGHVDQGDIDFWYERPSNVAVRCSKFGDTISLFGTDGTMQWFYDAREEVLYAGELEPDQYLVIASQPFSAQLLLSVLGLRPLPDTSTCTTRWCEADESYVVDFEDGSAIWLESGSSWPNRRQLTLPDASVMRIHEDPSRRHTVQLPGRPITEWPVLPGSVTMSMGHQQHGDISSILVFDRYTTEVEDEPMDRIFDLDHLKQALQPVKVRSLNELSSSHESGAQE